MSDPQFDAFTARVVDRYAIGEEIGRGSQATVYRAREVASGATVAVKVFHADLASALDSAQFLKQMRNTARVRHPGIVPVLAVDEAAGRLFVVTPFVEGESLRSRLKREHQLPLLDAVAITEQVADALDSAHVVEALSALRA